MEEVWKDVVGYDGFEGYYQISNQGNVKSLARTVIKSDGVIQHRKERIMSKRISTDGYYIAKFNVNKKSKTVGIHILVAQHFIVNPEPEIRTEVNHKDCNRKNNCVENLNWCTHEENIAYSAALGHYKNRTEDKNGRAVRIRIIFNENEYMDFNCIGLAAQYLINNNFTCANINSIRGSITQSAKSGNKYLGLNFERI